MRTFIGDSVFALNRYVRNAFENDEGLDELPIEGENAEGDIKEALFGKPYAIGAKTVYPVRDSNGEQVAVDLPQEFFKGPPLCIKFFDKRPTHSST